MQAFILAAGLGTRLRPLTDTLPKALVKVGDKPLVRIAIDNLIHQGATRIVINIHHHADLLTNYLHKQQWDVELVISDERNMLLDTGGGLKKAAHLFSPNEPILIHNVDILSHINFHELFKHHTDSMNLVTLAVSQRNTSRQLLFDHSKQLVGWHNQSTNETKWVHNPQATFFPMAFSGITIVQPQLLDLLPPANHPYPIIPEYISLAKEHRISYFEHNAADWLDVGKPETLQQAQSWMPKK